MTQTLPSQNEMVRGGESPLDEARRLRAAGKGWKWVAQFTGSTEFSLRSNLEPGFLDRHRQRIKDQRAVRLQGGDNIYHRVSPEEAQRAIAAIPRDTRGFKARLFGDPLPGRSALDRRSGN